MLKEMESEIIVIIIVSIISNKIHLENQLFLNMAKY